MQWSMGFRMCVFVVIIVFTTDAWAARSGIRVDGGAGWTPLVIGSTDCPGTTAGSAASDTLVRRFDHVFSGHENVEHVPQQGVAFCEIAFNDVTNLFDPRVDDPAYSNFGIPVVDITSYSFLDGPNVFNATSFQWEFIELQDGTTIVRLRGSEVLDVTSYIESEDGTEQVWSGAGNNYDGEYFCFRNNAYVGTWDGQGLFPASPCAAPVGGSAPTTLPTLGDATRGGLILLLALLAIVTLRRRANP